MRKWGHIRVKASRVRKSVNTVEKFQRWCVLVIGTGLGLIQNWRALFTWPILTVPELLAAMIAPIIQARKPETSLQATVIGHSWAPKPTSAESGATKAGKPQRIIDKVGIKSISHKEQGSVSCRTESMSNQEISSLQDRESVPFLPNRFHHKMFPVFNSCLLWEWGLFFCFALLFYFLGSFPFLLCLYLLNMGGSV